MVQSKRLLAQAVQDEGERPKRQNSGDLRPRSRRVSSEESAYTTDEASDEEEEEAARRTLPRKSCKPPRRWQPSEDRRLAESVKEHGEANWKSIAARVGSRNHVQCLQRWKKVLRPGLVKGQWSAEEDAVLMKLATSGFKNWGVLSNHMPGRTSKQCRERWCHHLDPSINKGAYTPEEDKIIIETQAKIGNKWSQIAARLPGRTENSIKIRCKALQRRGNGIHAASTTPRTLSKKSDHAPVKKGSPAAASLSQVTDPIPEDDIDDRPPRSIGFPLEGRQAPSRGHVLRRAELPSPLCSPPQRSPVSHGLPVPINPGQHAFREVSAGPAPSSMNAAPFQAIPTSYAGLSTPAVPTLAAVEARYEDPLGSWPKSSASVTPQAGGVLPHAAPLWPATSASEPAALRAKTDEPSENVRVSGSFLGSSHAVNPSMGICPAPSATPLSFSRGPLTAAPDTLSEYFQFGANSIIGHNGPTNLQGEGYAGMSQAAEVTPTSSSGMAAPMGEPLTRPARSELEEEFGDLSTLDVKYIEAAVGQEDEDVAPLRACCSFLDLAGEGVTVGEMPLSW